MSTPNGRRETYAMATEFQMHPDGIIETGSSQPGISNIMIPRLIPKQVKSVNNSRAVPLIHYTGPKKVLPPAISKNIEIRSVCSTDQSGSCPKERCRVAQFPHEGARCNGVEWFQKLLSQESECSETCKHICLVH